MTREKKIEFLKHCCAMNGPCAGCPAVHVTGEKEECDFDAFDDDVLDQYYDAFVKGATYKLLEDGDCTGHEIDNVHPQHYKLPGGMEVIDIEVAMFGREAVMHHCFCTAAEYILRHVQKNGVEDIRKAHWWLSKFIELESGA